MKKSILFIILAIVLVSTWFAYTKTQKPTDPFAGVTAQSYGTEGKITAISPKSISVSAAVSSKKNDVVYIDYQTKTYEINKDTKIYKLENRKQTTTNLAYLKQNMVVRITSKANPNTDQALIAEEIAILPK